MFARVFISSLAVVMWSTLAAAQSAEIPTLSVHEASGGAFVVVAGFSVAAPAAVVRDVITDYEDIPRFMPDIRISRVIARQDAHVEVEQEAVSKYLMFSKKVHLLLDVEEGASTITFRDRCSRSFEVYEGAWTISAQGGRTDLRYRLTARPAFGVPGVVLRKLLDRDSRAMIDRLAGEIAIRAAEQR